MGTTHKPYYRHVRAVIRRYPGYCEQLAEMTAKRGDDMPARSPGKISRPTERLALLSLPDAEAQREYDAVRKAISFTERMKTGAERLEVIRLKYWRKRPGDLYEAARAINYGYQQTWRFHAEFEQLVAAFLKMENQRAETMLY